jgi:hypothetical protein
MQILDSKLQTTYELLLSNPRMLCIDELSSVRFRIYARSEDLSPGISLKGPGGKVLLGGV